MFFEKEDFSFLWQLLFRWFIHSFRFSFQFISELGNKPRPEVVAQGKNKEDKEEASDKNDKKEDAGEKKSAKLPWLKKKLRIFGLGN